jgi:PKD repeat protein
LPSEESSSGARSGTTGRIAFRGCLLEVGDAAGSRLALASTQEDSTGSGFDLASTQDDSTGSGFALASTQGDSRALRRAVARRSERKRRTPSEKIETAVENASEVTSKVEHTLALLKDVADGSIDIDSLSDEADALLGLLQRLDRTKRWDDVLRVARCLSALLALLGRWIELLRSLRTALQAAELLGDPLSEAWALHELGTLHLLAGRHAEADRQLGKAREIRERYGSRDIKATNNNLQVLCQTLRRLTHRRPIERMLEQLARRPVLALATAATLLAVGGAAGAALAHSSDREKPSPVAAVAFSFVPSAPHTGQDIVFSATATDARDPVASYTWQWGDGDPATERVQRHEYRATGRYKVVLTVRDAHGRVIGKIARWVTIRRPKIENGPNAYFSFQPHSPVVGKPVLFDAGSSYDPRAPITSYEWSFGDGQTARGVTASHSFAQSRIYRVALAVSDTNGRHNTLVQKVSVTERPGGKKGKQQTAKQQTTVALRCPAGRLQLGEAVNMSGSITPARPGVPVKIIFRSPSGESTTVDSLSESAGLYKTSFQPKQEGSWSVQSSQAESNGYEASTSERCTFTVTKPKEEPPAETRTTVSCPSNPTVGKPVNVSGVLVPARAGVEVRVIFRSPSHEETPFNPTSSAEGAYDTSFTPKEPGIWTVQSSQAESSEYQASSATCSFTAEELD